GGPLHLAFNLLALFVFGPDVEERMGGGSFLAYYLLCGLGGAALSFALMQFRPVELVIGASAAVYGVLLAFAWVAPDRPIYVFPLPEPIPAKWLVTFTVAVSLGLAIFPPIDKVSHLAHLGGFGAGFLYLKVADWRLALEDPAGIDPDSQLAGRRLPEARRAAEQFVAQQPSDPHAHLALGWVWQAWPAAGRYRALDEFRTAERLAPGEPAPLWGQVAVGYRLGSDEGEGIARRALLRLLELRPGDRLAWARFLELYHDDAIWRRVDRALALHPDDLVVLEQARSESDHAAKRADCRALPSARGGAAPLPAAAPAELVSPLRDRPAPRHRGPAGHAAPVRRCGPGTGRRRPGRRALDLQP